jgi:hypothetical protein
VIKEWNFLGPFPIGKTEVDGDPVAHFGGAHQALKQSLEIKHIYRSELVSGGTLSWTKLKAVFHMISDLRLICSQSVSLGQKWSSACVSSC